MIVALLGAECTGKSTLARALAARLGAGLVTEYLREWCEARGTTPRVHEQADIAAEQARRIEHGAAHHELLIADTTPLMTALFSQHYFGDDSLLPQALAFQRRCDLTLLCAPDLPWQADGYMRDGPGVRAAIDTRLRDTLRQHGLPWQSVQGSDDDRLNAALRAIRQREPRGN
jgi:nicotinamide riboside kinase